MYKQVENHVHSCKACIMSGNIIGNTNSQIIRTSEPDEMLVIDLVGPLPRTTRGSRFLITCVDYFSKFPMAEPFQAKSSEEVRDFIINQILPNFPHPIKLFLSDNGLEFKANEILNQLSERNIEWKFGSPYHPQTQGAVERFNDTIIKKKTHRHYLIF